MYEALRVWRIPNYLLIRPLIRIFNSSNVITEKSHLRVLEFLRKRKERDRKYNVRDHFISLAIAGERGRRILDAGIYFIRLISRLMTHYVYAHTSHASAWNWFII